MQKLGIALCLTVCFSAFAYCQNKTYTVQKGDNDWAISKKLHLTVHELHLLNPKTDWLHLKLGSSLNTGKAPAKVAPKATKSAKVASKKPAPRKEESEILVESLSHDIFAESPKTQTAKASGAYCVRSGDNDWIIASRVGISSTKLRALNPNVNWSHLAIGTYVRIPSGSVVRSAPSKNVAQNTIRSRYAKVSRDSVIIRRGPGADTAKVTVVESGLLVSVLDRSSGWYKCKFPKGTVGWVRGDMLKAASKPKVQRSSSNMGYVASRRGSRRHHGSTEIVMNNPDQDNRLLAQAFRMKGVPYRYGMSSTRGSDCSGFTSLVYRSQGVKLPRTSRDQSRIGQKVDRGGLSKGDLVFFKTNRGTRINHVGIYIGNGKFIHASSGGGKVQVNSLSEGYYARRYATARRPAGKKK